MRGKYNCECLASISANSDSNEMDRCLLMSSTLASYDQIVSGFKNININHTLVKGRYNCETSLEIQPPS